MTDIPPSSGAPEPDPSVPPSSEPPPTEAVPVSEFDPTTSAVPATESGDPTTAVPATESGDPTTAVPVASGGAGGVDGPPPEGVAGGVPPGGGSRRRNLIVAGVVVVALLVAGGVAVALGGGDGDDPEPVATPRPSTTTTTEKPVLAPLTGLPYEQAVDPDRPALVVKIDDSPTALGRQSGINQADIVYVEQVEGGYVRLAAVFQSTDATAGPIRSARTTDVDLTANLNGALFAYSGANGGVLNSIRSANLVDVGVSAQPQLYESRNNTVLRYFADTNDLWSAALPESSAPAALFTYRQPGQLLPTTAEDSGGIHVDYGIEVDYVPRLQADLSVTYDRTQGGTAHLDDQGERVSPDNVVVLSVQYRDSGYVDAAGGRSPEAVTIGQGEAWVLTGGKLVRGTWSRPTPEATFELLDATGAPLALTPGQTWVELAPIGGVTPVPPAPAS